MDKLNPSHSPDNHASANAHQEFQIATGAKSSSRTLDRPAQLDIRKNDG